jgi:hypothetical protein
MCGDYHLVNKWTRSKKYAMPLPEEIFDAFCQAMVFSTLDLSFGCHQLPLREGDKVKITFCEINPHGKDCLYQWKFLASLGFAKCYIDDIIVFNLTLRDRMHHLQEVFGRIKEHTEVT